MDAANTESRQHAVRLPDAPQPLFALSGEPLRLTNGGAVHWQGLPPGQFRTQYKDLYRQTQRESGAVVMPKRRFRSHAPAPVLEAGFFAFGESRAPASAGPLGYALLVEEEASCLRLLNTGLVPEARGQGLYSAWIHALMDWARNAGFAELRSRHRADHNALLIPKLKAGFRICGLQVDPRFGILAELRLPFAEDARDLLAWRMGSRPEDERIRRRRFT